jgi:hypothetical protein
VGPRTGGGDEDQTPTITQRAEPSAGPPANPLEVPPEVRARIGTDWDGRPPAPVGQLERSFSGVYYSEQRNKDYRFRFVPPLYLEHTRYPESAQQDQERLWALLFYQRRSPKLDADVLFPLAWRVRERKNHVLVLGPLAHREAPGEVDNWLAPLFFTGSRPDGGYAHIPPLLATSHWSKEGAFTMVGPYFRDRAGTDTDLGVVPFFFHGDNGNLDGARRTYTLVPPLLYFHSGRSPEASASITPPSFRSSTTAPPR